MDNKEAIEILKLYRKRLIDSPSNLLDKDIKAFDIGIKSLEGQKTGHWNKTEQTKYCPKCGTYMGGENNG